LLDRFRRYTQHLIHADNDFHAPIWDEFDTLCLAQHYGLPTLLMDWTLNPYVAAYFALSGAYHKGVREELAGRENITKYWARVWVMRLKEPDHRADQTVHLENRKGEWDQKIGNLTMTPSAPLVVVPLVFTRRIAAQAGRFVYCGYMSQQVAGKGTVDSLAKYAHRAQERQNREAIGVQDPACWDQFYSLDIEFDLETIINETEQPEATRELTHDRRVELLRDGIMKSMVHLEFTGFHAGRLFPDLEGWAKYLAEGNL
jgi:hypothetical protein